MQKFCFHVLFITCFISYYSFSQDTIVVVRSKWQTTTEPFLGSITVYHDTIIERRGRTSNYEHHNRFTELTSQNNYFYFIDKHGRKMMESHWNVESIYGDFVYYYKNGNVKIKGTYNNGNCSKWECYKRNGKLKKVNNFGDCPAPY